MLPPALRRLSSLALFLAAAVTLTAATGYQQWVPSPVHPLTVDVYGFDHPADRAPVAAPPGAAAHANTGVSSLPLSVAMPMHQERPAVSGLTSQPTQYHTYQPSYYDYATHPFSFFGQVPMRDNVHNVFSRFITTAARGADEAVYARHYGDDSKWRVLLHSAGSQLTGEKFSQEYGGLSRIFPYPIYGMKCLGSFCDDKRLLYVMPLRQAPLQSGVRVWTEYISRRTSHDGHKYTVHCPRGMFVLQVQCKGKACSTMRLGCTWLRKGFRARYELRSYEKQNGGKDALNAYFSEEGTGTGLCPDGEYLDGIQCNGFFCDNIRLYCSIIQIRKEGY